MPVHDWTRVDSGIFHDFHQAWLVEIKKALNAGRLPAGYYALVEQKTPPAVPDVVTLQLPTPPTVPSVVPVPAGGGVAVLDAPPKVLHRERQREPVEEDEYVRRARVVTVRHLSGHRVVAVVEVISPGNKCNRRDFDQFVEKAVGFLTAGIHLLLVDLFPPTARDPDGIHPAVWGEIQETDYRQPADKPLTLAGYSAGMPAEAFVQPVAVGDSLPDMPLFFTPERYVDVPLEATYQAAWETVPPFWQEAVGG